MNALLLVLLLAAQPWDPVGSTALITSMRPAVSARDAHAVRCEVTRWNGRASVQSVSADLDCPAPR